MTDKPELTRLARQLQRWGCRGTEEEIVGLVKAELRALSGGGEVMSNTPRTDAELIQVYGLIPPFREQRVSANFARQLERELSRSIGDALEGAVEINRLRDGLRWYADGHHYDLENWEDCSGESANWLFPPTDDGWMIDNGGIARAILDYGHSINPNHKEDDNITIEPDAALSRRDKR